MSDDAEIAENVLCQTAGICSHLGFPHEDGCLAEKVGPLVRVLRTARDEAARLEREMWIEYCEEDARQLRDGEYPERATVSSDIALAMKDCGPFSTRLAERDREQFNEGVEAVLAHVGGHRLTYDEIRRALTRPPAEPNDLIQKTVADSQDILDGLAKRDREGEG